MDAITSLRILTVPLGAANTEVKYIMPTGIKSFIMQARNNNEIRIATESGIVQYVPGTQSVDPRFSLKTGAAYTQEYLNVNNFQATFYFSCSTANEVLEIIIGV